MLAAGAQGAEPVAAAVEGGHGELFVQQFDGSPIRPQSDLFNLPPSEAAAVVDADLVIGSAARILVEARGRGRAVEGWPSAKNALLLPEELRTLAPKPVYARAPDARAKDAA